MYKKLISIVLAVVMLVGIMPVISFAADTTIYLGALDFTDPGTYVVADRDHGSFTNILRSPGGGRPENLKSANVTIKIPADGTYTVYARICGHASADRSLGVVINGTAMEKAAMHNADAFKWVETGKIELKAGEAKIEIADLSADYGRFEALALTTAAKITLPEDGVDLNNAFKTFKPEITSEKVDPNEALKGINPNLPQGETPKKVKNYFLGASNFEDNLGTWIAPGKDGSELPVLRSPGGQKPSNTKPAITSFKNDTEGKYFVWAWTRDYGDGMRTMKVAVDGKLTERVLGAHLFNGFAWEYCGEIELGKKDIQVEVVDSGNNYGRIQGVFITNDPKNIPTDSSVSKYAVSGSGKGLTSNITGVIDDPNAAKPDEKLVADEFEYIVVTAKDFNNDNKGSWQMSDVLMGSFFPHIMMSKSDGRAHTHEAATFKITVPKTGIYKVIVRSHDAANNSGRKFQVYIGDTYVRECGVHGQGWGFEEAKIPLVAGENEIRIVDHTGNYSRWDMIVITDNLDFVPGTTQKELKALAAMAEIRPSEFKIEKDAKRPNDEIAINLNGEYMTFDVPPLIINSRTMVPFRAIFEALNCTVGWDNETRTASGSRNGTDIRLRIDSTEAKVGPDKFTLDSPATIVDSRTVVPLRFISEALGAKVAWEGETKTVFISAEIPPQMIMLTAESYYDVGTWHLEGVTTGSFESGVMRGLVPAVDQATPADGDPSKALPAKANITVAKDGQYKVFVHSRDYTSSYTSQRTFAVAIDGAQIGGNMGTHGNNGFSWQEAGVVNLTKGDHTFELIDTSGFYARCDMVIITEDMDYKPSTAYSELIAMASPVRASKAETAEYPMYAREDGQVTDEKVIANDKVQVKFYTVNTSNGPVIQNEIYTNVNGTWVKTNNRSEQNGFMVIRTDKVSAGAQPQDRYVYSSQYQKDGQPSSYMGIDIYKAGVSEWYIPTQIETIDEKTVKLTANGSNGTITATWAIVDETVSPKVTVDAVFNKDGSYTIGAAEGDELTYDQFYFALAPFRVQSKRVDEDGGIYNEQYLFTPMGCYTLEENNAYSAQKVTKGVVVDPSMTRTDVVKRTDGEYGIAMKGADGGYQGIVFAPILGQPDANLKAGETTTFSYRVISTVSDWFDNYKFIAQDIYEVDSYRQHIYANLNEAIFNTRKYSLDNENSGWDPLDKGYWNIESKNTVATADPMQALQTYLLTEDENYLVERTLPTLAAFMTRGNLQFNSKGGLDASNGYISIDKIPYPIGDFINIFNMNVRGGLYELTRGQVPYLLETGINNTIAGKNINGYNSMTPFSDDMYMYQYTGDKKYLDNAMKLADIYLKDVVYGPQELQVNWDAFIYTSYYPNLPALVDLYELTGEQRYLDAAYYTAQYLLTTIWIPGVTKEQRNSPLLVNYDAKDNFNGYHNWYGDEQRVLGKGDQGGHEETVEAWTTARAGLGLEQANTFLMGGYSGNIIMSMWVGDMLKLATWTGDEYLATAAENAMVGRFANYSGYYYGRYGATNIQNKADYPYKGPDVSGVYYHHLPPFMAMLEDFLITLPMYRSNGKIEFPSVRQSGYAFFYSNHYGYEAGKVYDMNDMWLWMDEGVLDSGHLQIDWMGARKDGTAAFMLMNQSAESVTTTVTLGEKVGAVSDTATLYDADGNKTNVSVSEGKVTVTVPAKGMVTLAVAGDAIKAPAFSEFDYKLQGEKVETGSTYFDHGNGKAIVLQMNPNDYYAYVYVTDKPADVKEVKLTYTADGEKQTVTTTAYPYEFIIKVDDVTKGFDYDLELTKVSGEKVTVNGSEIKPLN